MTQALPEDKAHWTRLQDNRHLLNSSSASDIGMVALGDTKTSETLFLPSRNWWEETETHRAARQDRMHYMFKERNARKELREGKWESGYIEP